MSHTTRERPWGLGRRRLLLALLAAAVAVSGCSAGDEAETTLDATLDGETGAAGADTDAGGVEADAPAGDESAERDTAGGGSSGATAPGLPVGIGGGAFAGRDVIRTAELELRDDDTRTLVEAIETTVDRIGGFVASAELAPAGAEQISGRMTLRVPNERLDATLADLSALADEIGHRHLSTEDVTDQLTDIEAQLVNLRALEAELRELLAEVRGADPDAQEVLAVFERLREVRGEIERLEARRASLQDRVALSTITVVVDPIAPVTALAEPDPWRPGIVVEEALGTTARALQAIVDAAIWLLLTALPVALVVLAPPVGIYLLWRRHRTTHPAPS